MREASSHVLYAQLLDQVILVGNENDTFATKRASFEAVQMFLLQIRTIKVLNYLIKVSSYSS
jgi:hypothetical protein